MPLPGGGVGSQGSHRRILVGVVQDELRGVNLGFGAQGLGECTPAPPECSSTSSGERSAHRPPRTMSAPSTTPRSSARQPPSASASRTSSTASTSRTPGAAATSARGAPGGGLGIRARSACVEESAACTARRCTKTSRSAAPGPATTPTQGRAQQQGSVHQLDAVPVEVQEHLPHVRRRPAAQGFAQAGGQRLAIALQEQEGHLVHPGARRGFGVRASEPQLAGGFCHILDPVLPMSTRRADATQQPGVGPALDGRNGNPADAGEVGSRIEAVPHPHTPHSKLVAAGGDGFGRSGRCERFRVARYG